MKSLFDVDSKFEKAIIEYIKKNAILEFLGLSEIQYITDRATQKKGIDVIAKYQGKLCYFDIKSIASDLPTFSQEVINTTSGNLGWMFNNDLETTHHIYSYHIVEGAKNYFEGKQIIAENPSKIIRSEFIVVEKKTLQNDIEKTLSMKCNKETAVGLTKAVNTILHKKNTLATTGNYKFNVNTENGRRLREINSSSGLTMWITRSNGVHEKPINIIVRKKELIRISTNHLVYNEA